MTLDINIGDGADALTINQLADALNGTYWIGGWAWSLGSGDYEVDIAPGDGSLDNSSVSTDSTQTVDLGSEVDVNDPRKAVIYVDEVEAVDYAVGDPVAAAPAGETRFRTWDPAPPKDVDGVVVAEVWLAANASEIVGDDVRSRRVGNTGLTEGSEIDAATVNEFSALDLTPPIFGDGSDGTIVRSSNITENRIVSATTYTIESGSTISVDEFTVIKATDEIVVDGTITADGEGGLGGSGGEGSDGGNAGSGDDGEDGFVIPVGSGGNGGGSGSRSGGDGGDGDDRNTIPLRDQLDATFNIDVFNEGNARAGAGGGGGGGSEVNSSFDSASNGQSPGGGGEGSSQSTTPVDPYDGGDGGDGGGFIMLSAPKITINGSVTANGQDGQDGDADNSSAGSGSGAGGGGSGGCVIIAGGSVENNGTVQANGGSGGQGGAPDGSRPGGNGGNGANGKAVIIG